MRLAIPAGGFLGLMVEGSPNVDHIDGGAGWLSNPVGGSTFDLTGEGA